MSEKDLITRVKSGDNAHAGLTSWSFNVGKDIFACDTLDVAMIFGS